MTTYALVTGAGQGIGFGIARRLAEDGFHVYATDRSMELAEKAAAKIGGTALHLDVSDGDSVDAAAAKITQLSVLVNSAGIYPVTPFPEVEAEEFDRLFHVNVRGPMMTIQRFAPIMAQGGGGSIINVTSNSQDNAVPGVSAYSASKAAEHGITKLAALEYAPQNIRVNSVAPGSTQTEGMQNALSDGETPRSVPLIPLGRAGSPSDIANVVSFFAGPDSQYVTGQSLTVDGGFTGALFNFYRAATYGSPTAAEEAFGQR